MTRKPRRHALTVPVRSGSEVGFPQSLGEVHDMLYDKSLERDNCGFGLIAHIEGEPSQALRTPSDTDCAQAQKEHGDGVYTSHSPSLKDRKSVV